MEYLEIKDGLIVVVDGESIEVKIGNQVRLFSTDGDALFAEINTDGTFFHYSLDIVDINNGRFKLKSEYIIFTCMITVNDALVERGVPAVVSITGTKYGTNRDVVIDGAGLMVSPGRAMPEEEPDEK